MEVEISRSMTASKLNDTLNSLISNLSLYMTSKLGFQSEHIYIVVKQSFTKIKDFYVSSMKMIEDDKLGIVFTDLDVSENKAIQTVILRELGFDGKPCETDSFESCNGIPTNSTKPDTQKSLQDMVVWSKVGVIGRQGLDIENTYDVSGNTSPFSFAKGYINKKEDLPAPLYLSLEYINENYNSRTNKLKSDILKEFKINHKNQVVLVDKEIKKSTNGIVKEMLGLATKMFFQGKNLGTLTLPTRILSHKTQLTQTAELFNCLQFIHKAVQAQQPIEKLKYVIVPFISNFYYGLAPKKPFNPYLGETLQGHFQEGSQIYLEHVNHCPPTDMFLIVNEKAGFRIHGKFEFLPKLKPNEVSVIFRGVITVELGDDKIFVEMGNMHSSGLLFGDFKIKLENSFYFYYPKAKLKAFVSVGPKGKIKKEDYLKGGIVREDKDIGFDRKALGKHIFPKNTIKKLLKEDREFLSRIEGNWLERIGFDGKEYWNTKELSLQLNLSLNPLPSDWRFREDLLWSIYGNSKIADAWKYKLEGIQREYRKQRKNFAKKFKL